MEVKTLPGPAGVGFYMKRSEKGYGDENES